MARSLSSPVFVTDSPPSQPFTSLTLSFTDGYYMLLDSTNARPGQKAVLLSPLSHSSGCLTLSFYYIMRGQGHEEALFVYATFLG